MAQLKARDAKMLTLFLIFLVFGFMTWCFLIDVPPSTLFKLKDTREIPQWVLESPITHRGLHKLPDVPENSLAAFQYAKEKRFGIELDTHLTKDGVVVIHHDQNLKRMTGREANISDLTYVEISELKLLKTDQKIPTLKQVLNLIKGEVPIYVELKNYSDEIGPLEESVYDEIQEYDGPLAVISFNPHSIAWYKDNAPEVLRGQTSYTFSSLKSKDVNLFKRFTFRNYLFNWKSKPDFLVYELRGIRSNSTLKFLKRYKVLLTYGIDDKASLELAQSYADNFMFDHVAPEISKQQIALMDFEQG